MTATSGEIKNVKIFSSISDKSNMFFQFRVEAKDNPVNGLQKSTVADVIVKEFQFSEIATFLNYVYCRR